MKEKRTLGVPVMKTPCLSLALSVSGILCKGHTALLLLSFVRHVALCVKSDKRFPGCVDGDSIKGCNSNMKLGEIYSE